MLGAMAEIADRALAWLRLWEGAIDRVDYAAGRALFSPDVVSFGTLTAFMVGIDELEAKQWRHIWPTIRDFRFEDPRVLPADGDKAAVVVSRWRSRGRSAEGGWYERSGRCTLMLRMEEGRLVCCHSHLSMDQGVPALAAAATARSN